MVTRMGSEELFEEGPIPRTDVEHAVAIGDRRASAGRNFA
jgi:hypothetical protein